VNQISAHPGPDSAATPAESGYVFNLGFEAGQHDAAERARLAAIALASAQPDEDGNTETRTDWTEFPIGLSLHTTSGITSVVLDSDGLPVDEYLDPDEADALADAIHAYAAAARSARR
jgi:hypothetical protein